MSRPLVPRPAQRPPDEQQPPPPPPPSMTSQRSRKISTACGACKQRKTRCSGGNPCDACASRNSLCSYDASLDQRRKIANQRNVHDLAEAQDDLVKCRQLLGGLISTIRAGDAESNSELVRLIRSNVDLSQLAAHVRNECRSNLAIQSAFDEIDFTINHEFELPSPSQVLGSRQGLDITEGVEDEHIGHTPAPGEFSFDARTVPPRYPPWT